MTSGPPGGNRDGAARFEGSAVLVTGGSKGIGRAIAMQLAREGASVAITWFRDRSSAERTVEELEGLGAHAIAIRSCLDRAEAADHLSDEVTNALGECRHLVSNAATGTFRPLVASRPRHWDWVLGTNTLALPRLAQAFPKAESILALSSLGSARVIPGYGIVGVSKAALEAMVRYLAVELAPTCRINAVSPGLVETESIKRLFPSSGQWVDVARGKTPLQRLVTPDDVARLACFLLSHDADMLTGQVVVLDGGYSLTA